MAAAVPGVAGGLVGRDGLVGRLHRLVDAAVAGRGSLTLLAGEPGAGKTAVLAATASHAASVGAACGQGAGWPGEGAPAYWPWRQVLRSLERSGAPAGTADILADAAGTDSHAAEAPSAARFRLHDTVTTALTTLARDRPLVVILDDLHWADEASVTLVEFLVPHLAATPMAVVGAYLDVGAPQVPALTRLTARADVVPLGGIATDAVARIVADAVGPDRADSVVADVVRRTGGNPFLVHQLCWLLAAGGSVGDVPAGVRGALEARYAAMDDDATDVQGLHEVLGAAAALGPRFEPTLLNAVTRLPRGVVAAALHVALRHRILLDDAAAGGTGELRFAHDLVHEYAAALLPDDARAAVHAAVADTLLTRRAAGDDVPAARIAAHAVRADAHGERARRASVEAAREAASGLAYEDAVRHWSNALTAADGPGRRALLLELAAARRRAGDGEGARRDVLAAVAAARQAGDAAALARAALELHTLGTRAWWPPDELVQVLEEALRALGADPSDGALLLRARVLGALGRVLAWTGRDPVRGRDLATEAVDAARASGDPAAEAEALLALHNARWAAGTALERLALAEEILALADGLPGRVPAEILLEARLLRAGDQLELGDARFRTGLEDFVRRAEASGQPRWRHAALVRRAMLALLDGRQEDAERLIAGARDLGERIGEPGARDVWFDQMWDLRESQGRLGEMLERVEDFVADSGSPPARALRAFALLALGRRDDAVAEMAPVDVTGSPSDAATTGPPPATHTATHTAAHTAAHTAVVQAASGAALARALGATQVAEQFWPVLAPHPTDTVVSGAAVTFKGAIAHHLGVLAVMQGRPDEARAHLERALAVHE
ncbi:MAG: ATP-binding protein, partial [Kineosporiaceae bacterium]